MTTTRTVFAALLLAALTAPSLSAQPPPGMPPPPGGRPMRGMAGDADAPGMLVPLLLRQPDLSDAQRTRIQAIMEADRGTLRGLFQQLDAANESLTARLVAPGTLDAAALQPDLDRVAAARRKLMEHGLATVIALREVLTPEQIARVAKTRTRLQELQREMRELLDGR